MGLHGSQHAEHGGALLCSLRVGGLIWSLQASPELSLDSYSPYNNNQTNMFV